MVLLSKIQTSLQRESCLNSSSTTTSHRSWDSLTCTTFIRQETIQISTASATTTSFAIKKKCSMELKEKMPLLRDKLLSQGETIKICSNPALPIINQPLRLNLKAHIQMMMIVLIFNLRPNIKSLKGPLPVATFIMIQWHRKSPVLSKDIPSWKIRLNHLNEKT